MDSQIELMNLSNELDKLLFRNSLGNYISGSFRGSLHYPDYCGYEWEAMYAYSGVCYIERLHQPENKLWVIVNCRIHSNYVLLNNSDNLFKVVFELRVNYFDLTKYGVQHFIDNVENTIFSEIKYKASELFNNTMQESSTTDAYAQRLYNALTKNEHRKWRIHELNKQFSKYLVNSKDSNNDTTN